MSAFVFKASRSFSVFFSTDLRILQDPGSGLVNDLRVHGIRLLSLLDLSDTWYKRHQRRVGHECASAAPAKLLRARHDDVSGDPSGLVRVERDEVTGAPYLVAAGAGPRTGSGVGEVLLKVSFTNNDLAAEDRGRGRPSDGMYASRKRLCLEADE